MRKILPIILIITALFSSCSTENKTAYAKDFVSGQDNQYMYYDAWNGAPLQKVEGGYVYYKSGFLYFADTKNGRAQPLCDKPNCLHENESENPAGCRAYIGLTESRNIQYYDGGIYCTVSETDEKTHETAHYIRRYDVDSLTIKNIVQLESYPSDGFIVHRGVIYIELYGEPDESGELNETSLYKLDLNGNKSPERICDFSKLGLTLLQAKNLQAYAEYVYFDAECVKAGTDLTDEDNDSFTDKRYGYNIQSGEMVCITDNVKGDEPYFCGYYKGKLLYASGDNRVYQANLDGKNTSSLFSYSKKYYGFSVFTDGKYFYFENPDDAGKYIVLNDKGKFLNKVELPFVIEPVTFYDKDFIIRLVGDDELRLVDKSKIAASKKLNDKLLYKFKNVIIK